MRSRRSTIDRFHDGYIPEPNSSCWLFFLSWDKDGYGGIMVRGGKRLKRIQAHRLSWQIHRGPIPNGLIICHTCDLPCCVNPDHLFLGTYSDNALDSLRKGRSAALRNIAGQRKGIKKHVC